MGSIIAKISALKTWLYYFFDNCRPTANEVTALRSRDHRPAEPTLWMGWEDSGYITMELALTVYRLYVIIWQELSIIWYNNYNLGIIHIFSWNNYFGTISQRTKVLTSNCNVYGYMMNICSITVQGVTIFCRITLLGNIAIFWEIAGLVFYCTLSLIALFVNTQG